MNITATIRNTGPSTTDAAQQKPITTSEQMRSPRIELVRDFEHLKHSTHIKLSKKQTTPAIAYSGWVRDCKHMYA